MSLERGTHLGPYEVLAKLGEGGMGEVYRAKDTKLNRDVALKILPEAFTTDADRLARFKREAQVLASLNHPNIAAIYGFEDSGATHALVMELVEGEDLSAPIARGPMPLGDALPIARQIADALEAAHEAGIIHRDLKPANIKVRADGAVKVLDFGLAKAMDAGESSGANAANSPTLTARATQMGMIIGTAAYMAPEQAKGRPVDRRADIWAFGVVFYEMLTGRRAFDPSRASGARDASPANEGASIVEVLASVLHHGVDWSALPADLPAPIQRLLRRCMEKDPRKRLSAIGDARLELDEGADEPVSVTASVAPPRRQRTLGIALAAVAGLWLLTLIPLVRSYWSPPASPQPLSFALTPFLGEPIRLNVNQPELAVSHDGRRLAYSYGDAGSTLVLRNLSGFGDTALTDLGPQPRSPFFSPDDEWIGYYSSTTGGTAGRLMKVPASGGQPFAIVPLQNLLRGASWGRDDTIVFATSRVNTGLQRVPAAGGAVEDLTTPAAADGEIGHRWPAVMPDGKHVVFTIARRPQEGGVANSTDLAVLDMTTRQWRVLLPGGSYPKFLAPGYLLYVNSQGLFAAPFDPVDCELRGQAVRVVGDVAIKPTSGAASFDASDNGTLAYIAGATRNEQRLAWVDRGVVTPIPGQPHSFVEVSVSTTEARAAVVLNDDGNPTVWVQDLARGTLMQVSPPGEPAAYPVWSSDEKFLYYGYYSASGGIVRASADGIGMPELVFKPEGRVVPTGATPDGKALLVNVGDVGDRVIQMLSLDSKPELKPLVAESGRDVSEGVISTDGRWLAYLSRLGAVSDVFIRSFPDVNNRKIQVSTENGLAPAWSADGRTLFFWQAGGAWRVAVAPDGTLGQAVQIVAPDAAENLGARSFVAPSGRMINVVPAEGNTKVNELRVVLNWVEALKQTFARGR